MKSGRMRRSGFTVVEVLIVLAVTSALFLSAMFLISGKQNQTEFDQAIQQVRSQIQQAINDVSNGYYPGLNNFVCVAAPTGPQLTASAGSGQGTNTGCIFMGKVIQFKVHGSNPEQFLVYSLAGLQQNSAGADVSSLSEAKPVVIAPSASSPAPNDAIVQLLQGGLTTVSMTGANGSSIGAVGFVESLASYGSTGLLQSSSQQVDLVSIPSTTLDDTAVHMASVINSTLSSLPSSDINPPSGVQICFASASTNQSGLINIGGNGRTLSVTLSIKGNRTCT